MFFAQAVHCTLPIPGDGQTQLLTLLGPGTPQLQLCGFDNNKTTRTQQMPKPTITRITLGEIHNDKPGSVIVCNAKRTHTESEPRKETLQLVSNFIKRRSARLASKASDRIIHEGVLSIIVTSGNARLLHFGGLSCYILLLL